MSRASKWAWSLFSWSILMGIIVTGENEDKFVFLTALFAIWLTVLGVMKLAKGNAEQQVPIKSASPPRNLQVKQEAKGKDFVIRSKGGRPLPLAKWANETNLNIDLLTWYEVMHIVVTNYSQDTVEELKDLGRGEIMVDDMISAFGKNRTTQTLDMWGSSPLSWDAFATGLSTQQFKDLEETLLPAVANAEKAAKARNEESDEVDQYFITQPQATRLATESPDMIFSGIINRILAKNREKKAG